ncbi:hypothetical protein MMMDOFMJ_4250 [Methylobacterium gnaphalii]|nr:hypothetical protein MMMDOFMJ_4250 [Methylobacterium gnaphalii]GLS48048.1 hypothetical protein GCM10007885_08920 [Methylobacterium gnaphalii]
MYGTRVAPAALSEATSEGIAMAVVSRSIYDEGRAAKAANRPDSDNPYPAGSQSSLDWLEGYTADEVEPSATGPDEPA